MGPSKKKRNVVVLKLKDWKLRPILPPPQWRSNYKSEKVVGGGFSSPFFGRASVTHFPAAVRNFLSVGRSKEKEERLRNFHKVMSGRKRGRGIIKKMKRRVRVKDFLL